VNRHLELLSDSGSVRFLRKSGNKGGGEWFVPYAELILDLKRVTYDDIISRKCGVVAARLLRIIREKGKVDEKMLSEQALLQPKGMRKMLAELQTIGALDLQEVPRGNDRAAVRSFYFWFHRPDYAYSLLLLDMYKSMTRLYQRLLFERRQHSILLAKCGREDVKGRENELLSEQELRDLQKVRHREQVLLIQIFRIDSLVRIFRDY
jgi:DNA-directed RNA polymerase III subunit RPC3